MRAITELLLTDNDMSKKVLQKVHEAVKENKTTLTEGREYNAALSANYTARLASIRSEEIVAPFEELLRNEYGYVYEEEESGRRH
jgi:hypothetical protein